MPFHDMLPALMMFGLLINTLFFRYADDHPTNNVIFAPYVMLRRYAERCCLC